VIRVVRAARVGYSSGGRATAKQSGLQHAGFAQSCQPRSTR
jgi:hypothetical protein